VTSGEVSDGVEAAERAVTDYADDDDR